MGSSSSGYRAPVEAPNTLQSMQEVTIVEAISEGPIVGLYTGDEKSIALNKNPLKTPEGAFTYQNVSWDIRLGLPDQEPFADVAGTESETGVGVEVTKYFPRASGSGSGAVTRTITNPNVTHVRVTLGVQGLYRQILDDEDRSGDTEGETVSYRVTVKDKDNNVVVRDDQSRTDKTMSQAQWSIKYALSGGAPWTVTVTKLHDDNEKSNIKNDLYWSSYTEIINRKMIYPHTALMMVRGNAETFGSSIPSRAYRVKGLIVEVPGNYDPATRTYSGIWDGTFQNAWTDNPAWILRDLIESDRYGLKKFFPPRWINPLMDKWTLYEIAKICDESVDDGFGGTEPRYTFNGQIMGAGEAREVVQSIASVFHGMTYWGSALMYATCDYPTDPLRTLNQSTINDGTLSYSTGSAREIHSVALVTWYDPDNYGEATIETVVDWDKYQRYGKSEVKVTAYGCYSRGQAYRHGLWTLLTEDEQWQCTLEQGLEGYDLMPGTVIKIADPNIMGIRYSGRAVNIGVDSVTLDAPVSLTVGETYTLYIVADDGTEESREITSRGTSNVVNVSAPFSKTFSDNPAWSISGTDAAPREFAVRSLKEKQDGRVEVSLREVNSGKYLQLESGIVLKRPPVRIKSPHGYIAAPTGLEVYANTYFDNGTPRQRLTFSWSASGDSDAALYEACYKTPSGSWNNFAAQRTSSVDIPAAVPGEWLFRVRACSLDGRYSEWAEKSYTLGGIALIPKAPVNLRATGGFRCATVAWDMPDDPLIGYFEVLMASSEDVADAAVVGKIYGASFDVYGLGVLDTRWFWVRSVSYADNGIYSDTVGPVSATTNALQASDLPDGTIQESHLASALQTEIAKIPDIEVDISEIVDDVAAREARIRSDVNTIKEGLQGDIALVEQKTDATAQELSDLSDATDTAVSRLSGDISAAAQQAAANVEAAKALLRGESRNLTDEMMEQLDALSEAVIGTLSMVKDVGDRLSDAGVYVDPDNGEVRIYGLDVLRRETDLRISNAEIMLDAQAAKISQKVTLAQVDERIAGMAFDNVGQLLLEGVNARIDDVSQELDAQKVELKSKASSVIVQEHTARIAQAEADLQGLDAAIALKASLVELDLAVARIEAAEVKIDAQNGTISGFVGQYADDFDALAEGVIQNASNQFENDKATRQAIAYAKQELIGRLNIVDGRLEAEAASRLILEAQIKNAAASLISEKELRAREDEAIATLVDRVIVDVDSNRAAIIEEAELRADRDEAYGKMHNAMIASVDDSAGDADLAALISGFRGEQSIRRQMAGFYSDLDTRVKENEIAEATKREALVAQMNENKALIETEQLVRAAENEALALRIDNAFVEVGDAKAAITEEAQARADQYGALATQISGISAGSSIDKQELLDAIAAESQARIAAIEAEAAARGTALTAEENARIAAIQQEAADRSAAIDEAVGEERRQRTADVMEVREANSKGLESYGTLLSFQIADSQEAAGEALMEALLSNENALKEQKRRLAAHYEYLDSRVNELGVAQAEDREALIVMMDGNIAAIKREQYVLADKNEALAKDIQTLFAEVGDANAAIIAEQEARASADAAAASRVDTLTATVGSNKSEAAAAIQSEADARIAAIEAEAAARGTALTAEENARIAAIQTEATARQQAIDNEAAARIAAVREEREARVSGDNALSSRINTLVSDVGGAMSAITEEAQTRADKDEAYGRLGTAMIAASDEDAGEAALYAAMLAHDIGRKLTEQFAVYYNTLDTRIKQGL
ncbi:TipJ family phage tail tip protein, partial [Synergistes jonesii]